MTIWHFRPKHPGEKERNPVIGEYFDEESIDRPAQALVREVIQNSLDANPNGGAINVRFYVSGKSGALSSKRAEKWLGGAWDHFKAKGSGLRDVSKDPTVCQFLVVEDRSTIGLEGDPKVADLQPSTDKKHKNHFYAFFRAEGVSENSGGRGKWGVGKTVFPRSSRVNTLFGITMRRSDKQRLLMGQTILRFHWVGNAIYAPDGMFGDIQNKDFVLPLQDDRTLDEFCRDFCVRWRAEPGLSVVVPYYHEDITPDAIVKSVATEYFFPILNRKLTVVVESPELPGATRTLDSNSLLDAVVSDESDIHGDLRSVIAFATEEVITNPSGQRHSLSNGPSDAPPTWSESLFPAESLNELGNQFMRGQPIALRVPVRVRETSGQGRDSYFDVFMRQVTGRGYAPIFIRNGIIIPKALEYRVRGYRLLVLVIIDDAPLATMLGDAETPAHTQWSHLTQNFRDKYVHGKACLEFVRSAPRKLAEYFSNSRSQRDPLALADFFPRPQEDDGLDNLQELEQDKPGEKTDQKKILVNASIQPFEVEHLQGGFRVRRNSRIQEYPSRLEICVAYDRSRGNPLSKYNRADFQLESMQKQLNGVSEVLCRDNRLILDLLERDFRVEVTGFDINRDVYVRAQPVGVEA